MNLQFQFCLVKHCEKLIEGDLMLMVKDYYRDNIIKIYVSLWTLN